MEVNPAVDKLARILRTDKHKLAETFSRLTEFTGKDGVAEQILEENEAQVTSRLLALGVPRDSSAKEIYDALISKIEADDFVIFSHMKNPDCRRTDACQGIGDLAKRVASPPKGFFLKEAKAREFLTNEPPREVMKFLGYSNVGDMLEKEDLFEIMCSLRFVEGSEWLNTTFFRQYETLTPMDFEEREILVKSLDEKWGVESQKFVTKKKHNISHLKEMGVVFIIPALLDISGEILRMFALILHYLHEVPFYSGIFEEIAKDQSTFTENFTSLLRGDVLEDEPPATGKSTWLVVQRYLAKEDNNDWRLFVPHINPEALHWTKAEEKLSSVGDLLDGFSKDLVFWKDLGWVGDYAKDESGIEVLVSYNLVDTVMSLVKQKDMVKYLYHHQEALWNKVFVGYFGEKAIYDYSRKHILDGYFQL